MSAPRERHIRFAKHVLKYLKGTKNVELIYESRSAGVTVYADADYANDSKSKSVTGWMMFHHGNLISWQSRRQSTVATSTTEAEVTAMKSAACECVYLYDLLSELEPDIVKSPFIMCCDNQSACKIVCKGGSHDQTKHYRVRVNFVHDCVESRKIIQNREVSTDTMLADCLTKALTRPIMNRLYTSAGMALASGGVLEH